MPNILDKIIYYDGNLAQFVGFIVFVDDADNVRVQVWSADGGNTFAYAVRCAEPTAYDWMPLS